MGYVWHRAQRVNAVDKSQGEAAAGDDAPPAAEGAGVTVFTRQRAATQVWTLESGALVFRQTVAVLQFLYFGQSGDFREFLERGNLAADVGHAAFAL
jgi:hypothetical protein